MKPTPLAPAVSPMEYRLLTILGKGGTAVTYLAEDDFGRRVAMKVVDPRIQPEANLRTRALREVQALRQIQHPSVVQVLDHRAMADGRQQVIMDFVAGVTLATIVEHFERVPAAWALRWVIEVLEGLEAAHQLGIVHRDIKPSNIIIAQADLGVRVIDFGCARFEDASEVITTYGLGNFIGTARYASPEQCSGKPAEGASDQYAVGALLYELLVGQSLYPGLSREEVMIAHVKQRPPLLEPAPGTPVDLVLQGIVHRAVAKEPKLRFPSARAFGDALKVALTEVPYQVNDAFHVQLQKLQSTQMAALERRIHEDQGRLTIQPISEEPDNDTRSTVPSRPRYSQTTSDIRVVEIEVDTDENDGISQALWPGPRAVRIAKILGVVGSCIGLVATIGTVLHVRSRHQPVPLAGAVATAIAPMSAAAGALPSSAPMSAAAGALPSSPRVDEVRVEPAMPSEPSRAAEADASAPLPTRTRSPLVRPPGRLRPAHTAGEADQQPAQAASGAASTREVAPSQSTISEQTKYDDIHFE